MAKKTDNKEKVIATSASVTVMRSYDYCHFEVSLQSNVEGEFETLDSVDAMRKEAAKLVDKAVEQYKQMQELSKGKDNNRWQFEHLEREALITKENVPQSEWTPEQKAIVKKYEDAKFYMSLDYDYDDDWVGADIPF